MNRLFKTILLTFVIALIILPLSARTASNATETGRKWDLKWADIGELNMTITNYGIFGHNVLTGDAGGFWPGTRPTENYIYGCGLWFGALIDTLILDGDTLRDTLVSVGYNPNSGAGEMVPGDGSDFATVYTNPNEIVYKSTSSAWPPKDADGVIIFDSIVSMQDVYCEYSDKDPAQHFAIENKPLEIEIRQSTYAWVGPLKEDIIFMLFRIKNARDDGKALENCFIGVTTDCDIGLEAAPDDNDLLGFIDTITVPGDTVVSQMNLGYQFQLEDEDGWENTPGIVAFKYMRSPAATKPVDIDHDGNIDVNPGLDTLYNEDGTILKIKPTEIGMSTFIYFTLQTDPTTKQQRYQMLAGYDYMKYDPVSPELSYTPFPEWGSNNEGYPGQNEDPITAEDKRFIMGSGPFSMQNDSTVEVVVAVMVAANYDELLDKAIAAQAVYDADFKGPAAPGIPNMSVKGLNKSVLIYWDNNAESIPDKYYETTSDPNNKLWNPAYKQYDVEGYKVYRSKTGANWELLAQYDFINGITDMLIDSVITYEANALGTAFDTIITYNYDTVGSETGVPYYYFDNDTILFNGLTYYYMVKAYDYNYIAFDSTGGDTVGLTAQSMDGAGMDLAVIPRIPTKNFTPTEISCEIQETYRTFTYKDTINVAGDSIITADENSLISVIHPLNQEKFALTITPAVDTSIQKLEANTYFSLKFDDILEFDDNPAYQYTLYKHNGGVEEGEKIGSSGILGMDKELYYMYPSSIDPTPRWIRNGASSIISDGILFTVSDYSLEYFDWPTVDNSEISVNTHGKYDESKILMDYVPNSISYFRGSHWYQLRWHENTDSIPGDTLLTLAVWDMQNNEAIPYGNEADGNLWHFNPGTSEPFGEYMSSTVNLNNSGIYLPYIKLVFIGGRPPALDWSNRPVEGDIWDIVIATNDTLAFEHPPISAEYKINITPSTFLGVADSNLTSIKVVPNPYVVRCDFGLDYAYRKMYFTNLPNECTIHIYTLAGDKIKTIEHNTEFYRFESETDSMLVNDITNGSASWNILTDNDQIPAPGLYLYKVITPSGASIIGKFAIIK